MNMKPINADELRNRLSEGAVQFAYKKTNGKLRTAVGTTCLSVIPLDNHPTCNEGPNNTISYFDLEMKGWRGISESKDIFLAE